MSEILRIDPNVYTPQRMKSEGGGSQEDLTTELRTQDNLLFAQETKIEDLETELNNKIALDLRQATSDATATANDIADGKTAYVNGQKIMGMAEAGIDWSQIGYDSTPQALVDDFNYSKDIMNNWDNTITNLSRKFNNNKELRFMPLVDTSNVTDMFQMFYLCSSLYIVPLLNTTNVTAMNGMFYACSAIKAIPQFNTSNVTNMQQMFYNCSRLKEIPLLDTSNVTDMFQMFYLCSEITAIPQFNTTNVINMQEIFRNCTKLVYVPILDTSGIKNSINMSGMFSSCSSLSNESLNNILQMCINATSYSGTKTLKHIGLSSTQATTCQTLSNWSDFVAAGWTSGY